MIRKNEKDNLAVLCITSCELDQLRLILQIHRIPITLDNMKYKLYQVRLCMAYDFI